MPGKRSHTGTVHAVTLQDVADRAGLSLATVSRALNGSDRAVKKSTSERAHAAAAELGYIFNGPAQALARSTTSVVGLIVHEVSDPYFASIAAGALQVATQKGLLLTIAATSNDEDREIEFVQRLQAQRVRAIVVAGSGLTRKSHREALDGALSRFVDTGGEVAVVREKTGTFPSVVPPNRQGGALVARHLHELGHAAVAVIRGPRDLVTVRDRLAGFRAEWLRLGHQPDSVTVVDGGFTRIGGYHALLEMSEEGSLPTAIFALNDLMAIGAVTAAIDELQVAVPDDLSVVGFDDLWMAADVRAPLTTVRLPLQDMGRKAMELVLGEADTRGNRVECELVVRSSTGPCR